MRKRNKKTGKVSKEFNLREQYLKCFEYIRESKKFIYSMIVVFFACALIGFIFPIPESLLEKMIELIQELIEKTQDMSGTELTWFIFQNNLQSSFYGMIFGIFLGIFPVIIAILNGYILGFVALVSIQSEGILSLWRLLPHGIFELTAVFISLGLGMKLGAFLFIQDRKKSFRKYLIESLRVFLLIVLPLLIIAAIIEGILIALT